MTIKQTVSEERSGEQLSDLNRSSTQVRVGFEQNLPQNSQIQDSLLALNGDATVSHLIDISFLPEDFTISLAGAFISMPDSTLSYEDISVSWEKAFFNFILMPSEEFLEEWINIGSKGEMKSVGQDFLNVAWEDLFKIPVSVGGTDTVSIKQISSQNGIESLSMMFGITSPEDNNTTEDDKVAFFRVMSTEQSFITITADHVVETQPPVFIPPPPPPPIPPPATEPPPGPPISAGVPISISTDEDAGANFSFATLTSTGVGGAFVLGQPGDSVIGIVALGTLDGLGNFVAGGLSIDGAAIGFNGDGSITYNPTNVSAYENIQIGDSTTDTFAYQVVDNHGNIATQVVNLTITVSDDGFVPGVPVSISTDEDIITIIPLATLTNTAVGGAIVLDDLGDSLKGGIFAIGTVDAFGNFIPGDFSNDGASIFITMGTIAYDPTGVSAFESIPIGGSAADTFAYQVQDNHGNIVTQVVNVTVTAEDDGYAAGVPVNISTDEDDPAIISFATLTSTGVGGAIVLDDPGDVVKAIVAIGTVDGFGNFVAGGNSLDGALIVLNGDGSITYDPSNVSAYETIPVGGSTTDAFAYRAQDGHGNIVTQVVNVTITVADDGFAPGVPVSISTDEDVITLIPLATLTNTGVGGAIVLDDPGDSLQGGIFAIGTVDGFGNFVAGGDSIDGASIFITMGTIAYNPTGVSAFEDIPIGGSVIDTFAYQVQDNHGNLVTQIVNVTVTADDAGYAAGVPVNISTDEDDFAIISSATLISTGSGGAIVLDDAGDSIKGIVAIGTVDGFGNFIAGGSSIDGALIVLNGDGSITYDPTNVSAFEFIPIGDSTQDTFAYQVEDNHSNVVTQVVNVTLTVLDDGYAAGTPVSISTDEDDPAIISFATLTSTGVGGAIVLDDPGDIVKAIVAIGTVDGFGNFVAGGNSLDGALIVLNGDGSITYDPSNVSAYETIPVGGSTTDAFAYRAQDGHGNVVTQVVNVTITVADDGFAPGVPVSISTDEDVITLIPLATLTNTGVGGAIVLDDAGDSLQGGIFAIGTVDGFGNFVAGGDSIDGASIFITMGTIAYNPTGVSAFEDIPIGGSVIDSFAYQVQDNHGNLVTQIVNVTVTADDAGYAAGTAIGTATTEDTPITLTYATLTSTGFGGAIVLDDSGDSVKAIVAIGTENLGVFTQGSTSIDGATIVLNPDGSITYDSTNVVAFENIPDGDSVIDSFAYQVMDNHGNVVTQTVNVTITPELPTTLNVTTLSDTTGGINLSLRDAVNAVNAEFYEGSLKHYTINLLATGTYSLSSQLFVDANVTMIGSGTRGTDTIIEPISGQRAFEVIGGDFTLDTVAIQNGSASLGANILVDPNGDLTLIDSTIQFGDAGTSGLGGGIANVLGTVTITDSLIQNNDALFGGAIYNFGSSATLTITDGLIGGNNAGYGAGIYNDSGTVTITSTNTFPTLPSTFIALNFANVQGGGIWNNNTGGGTFSIDGVLLSDPYILNSTNTQFQSNVAPGGGSNIYSVNPILIDPIVLDLNHDGISLLSPEFSPMTLGTISGSSDMRPIGWIASGDGILMYDVNGNGKITNVDQVVFTGYSPGATTELQGLQTFDSNHNGSFDTNDAAFQQFGVLLANGAFESLSSLGINSISLTPSSTPENKIDNGNVINSYLSYTTTDGASHLGAEVSLKLGTDVNPTVDSTPIDTYQSGSSPLQTEMLTKGSQLQTQDVLASNKDHIDFSKLPEMQSFPPEHAEPTAVASIHASEAAHLPTPPPTVAFSATETISAMTEQLQPPTVHPQG